MSDKVKKYKVSIFGESYHLLTDESEEHIAQAASLVDMAMRELAQEGQLTDSRKIAILVAMQYASRSLRIQDVLDHEGHIHDRLLQILEKEII